VLRDSSSAGSQRSPVLIGKECSRDWFQILILSHYRVDNGTPFILYYRGHGFVLPDQPQQYLYLDQFNPHFAISGEVDHECLKKLGARLSVLITDCCADPISASPDFLRSLAPPESDRFADLFC